MISKYILRNELSRKRWRVFSKDKAAVFSSLLLLFFLVATLISPFIANSRPVVMKKNDHYYYPVLKDYSADTFGITDTVDVDYRHLELNPTQGDFALWPIIQWDPYESNTKVDSYPSKPTSVNLFGTDDRGRDVFTRVL